MKKGLLTIIKFEVVFLGLVIQVGLNDLRFNETFGGLIENKQGE